MTGGEIIRDRRRVTKNNFTDWGGGVAEEAKSKKECKKGRLRILLIDPKDVGWPKRYRWLKR